MPKWRNFAKFGHSASTFLAYVVQNVKPLKSIDVDWQPTALVLSQIWTWK